MGTAAIVSGIIGVAVGIGIGVGITVGVYKYKANKKKQAYRNMFKDFDLSNSTIDANIS